MLESMVVGLWTLFRSVGLPELSAVWVGISLEFSLGSCFSGKYNAPFCPQAVRIKIVTVKKTNFKVGVFMVCLIVCLYGKKYPPL